jgi:hypothetical protein
MPSLSMASRALRARCNEDMASADICKLTSSSRLQALATLSNSAASCLARFPGTSVVVGLIGVGGA